MDTIFNNIFNSWQKCYNKHIFIDNENDKIIIIDNNNENDNIHKTYYIEQSSNITCILNVPILGFYKYVPYYFY